MSEVPESRKRTVIVVAVLAAIAFVLLGARLLSRGEPLRHLTAKVERGEIRDVVEATGTVNAVVTVQVGSQVSGTIARLNADFNSRVAKGQVVALIDPRLFEGQLRQSAADLENARANAVAAQANLEKAKAEQAQAHAEHLRAQRMQTENVGTQQALDLATANDDAARASVDAAAANISQARAQVSQKDAAVYVARTNLEYTVIRSPIDGVVVARNVDVGQTVAASLQAPTIFTIAQDLTKMLVYAKVDESDVGRIRIHQPVTFKVDAFPKEIIRGAVREVRMSPTTVQNVVTYDAVVEFDNPDTKLFPGMTAYVTIPVASADGVVKVPNAALRYKPPMSPEQVRDAYARHGIDASKEAPPAPDAENKRAAARQESAVVWRLGAADSLEPVKISLGITDHTYTEVSRVLSGRLAPGDDVVTSSVASKSLPPGAQGIRR
jgi:HlyD family secretion protein